MSIVRVGLAETQRYSDGWDSIFSKGGSKSVAGKPKAAKKPAKQAARAKPKSKPKKSKK